MTNAGVWVRVSTGGQDEANRVPDVERYCAAHGYTIRKHYELNDRSAFKGEQEARQREALDDVRTGEVEVVVAWASDRVERRGAEATLRIFRKFREAGGRLESVLEPQLNGPDPDLMLAITGWKDQQESERKSERVRIAFDTIKANGAVYGGVPYGSPSLATNTTSGWCTILSRRRWSVRRPTVTSPMANPCATSAVTLSGGASRRRRASAGKATR